jgi:Putative collagen-binding domain of a collagenase
MAHLRDLLTSIPWWTLEPDTDKILLTAGLGSDDDRAVAARSTDRALALLYLPHQSRGHRRSRGGRRAPGAARWYDPADGRFSAVTGSPFPASGSRQFRPESGTNSSGFDD